jgi:hypothetical protein
MLAAVCMRVAGSGRRVKQNARTSAEYGVRCTSLHLQAHTR